MTFLEQLHQNFSIFPAQINKSPAVKSWIPYRTNKINFSELEGHTNFAVVCGFDNLEVIDIDNHFGDAEELFKEIYNEFDLENFPIITTKGGGYHIYYKCETIEGNKKLAQRINKEGKSETLVETRGVGGYVIAPPTKGYNVLQWDMFKVPLISSDRRNELLNTCKSLNEVETKKEQKSDPKTKIEGDLPGDKYLSDTSTPDETIQLLKQHGWSSENNLNFRRPGKKNGHSATFGKIGKNKFYVFSTNAAPFEENSSYTMFGVRTMLLHVGNYSECAKELAGRYGLKQKKEEKPKLPKKWKVLLNIIKDWKLNFRFNELTKVIEYSMGGDKYNSMGLLIGDIIYEMEVNRGIASIASNKVDEMLKNRTICTIYNPVREFFKNLPKWDGKDYFEEICKYITLDREEDTEYFKSMLKKHYIRTIRCALTDYINRMVFVFHGPQEIGKSMFFRWSINPEIYSEENIDPTDKDSILSLSRYVLLNMDDIDSLNKKEVSKLKGFVSKGDINKRVSYGRTEEKFKRTASFVASTNKSDILADSSNTRWIILKIKDFDWKSYVANIDPLQLWSQAGVEFKNNPEAGELTKSERMVREERNNSQFLETSTERELLIKYFEEGNTPMTATDILMILQGKNYSVKLNQYQLYRELKRIYGEPSNKRVNDKAGRYYYVTPLDIVDQYSCEIGVKEELPF